MPVSPSPAGDPGILRRRPVTVAGDSELSSRLAVGLSFALRDHWQPYLTRDSEAYCAFASLSEVGFEPRRLA